MRRFNTLSRFFAYTVRLRTITRVARSIMTLLVAASCYAASATAQYPDINVVDLREEVVSFTPVGGSILQSIMLGGDNIVSLTGFVLLPAREPIGSMVCIRITTRDGAYTGKGHLAPASNAHGLHAFRLRGEHFTHFAKRHVSASLAGWLATEKNCEVFESATLMPTAWSASADALTLRLLVNSSGYAARVMYKTSNDVPFKVKPCNRMATTGVARVYDTVCEVPLCDLAQANSVRLEVRNLGQRVHLEDLKTYQLAKYCESSTQ